MKGLFLACAAALAASPAVGQTLDVPPRFLEPHPDRESSAADGPYWVAASYAFMPDGAVRRAERIGATRRQRLVTKLESPRTRTAPDDTAPTELGCETSSEMAEMARELARFGKPIAYPPGDFRGWVAASDAVVLGTVTGFVPGFDQKGRPDTLVLLADTEHLYPSSEYPHFVKYVILPYARFVAGGMVFCAPSSFSTVEYYPEVPEPGSGNLQCFWGFRRF